ncbi:hypothetical protein B0A55_02265 [Friedmanniomyces simplex]|uniref:Galactose oxidase n=1 Tax=Friedmanniomyces simplex TaxID=329884 RepID=A0A4U0XRG3_9PEZI|nr:hypothetical protein B0A55_02265 [Friedmanniomyces simplex]
MHPPWTTSTSAHLNYYWSERARDGSRRAGVPAASASDCKNTVAMAESQQQSQQQQPRSSIFQEVGLSAPEAAPSLSTSGRDRPQNVRFRSKDEVHVVARWAQQSAIVNGTLYLYGGEATTEPGQTSDTWNNDFLAMDLTKTWPISSPSLTGLPQPSGPPAVSLGYLWNSYDSLFLYGGEYSWKPVVSPDPMAVWEYDIQSQSWIEHSDPTTSSGVNAQSNGDPVQRSAEGAGVSVPSLGRGFYFGGHQDGYTTLGWSQSIARIYLQSLLEFTFPGYANNQVNALGSGKTAGTDGNYRNITSAGLQADAGFTMRADGVLIYVPGFGDQGILLALAGGTNVTYTQMNNIDVYDIASSTCSSNSSASTSTLSTRSRHSRLSDGSGATPVVRRRGYMRPQGTAFADSARNRDSVMSLGSIAHMQYYFARTGLLDGKGAQLAKGRGEKRKSSNGNHNSGNSNDKENVEPTAGGAAAAEAELGVASLSLYDGASSYAVSDSGQDVSVIESPTEMYRGGGAAESWLNTPEPPMLPPTVSTYKQKPSYTEPLPDMPVLRRELKEALQDACKVIEETQKQQESTEGQVGEENNGFYEIQGLHILDILTLAIRAAKNYYTAHAHPAKLYAIKSERHIRAELYQVLDILKRMASRNFRGGMRLPELAGIIVWIESIDKLLKTEEQQEQAESAEREAWSWRDGDWTGREREREWLFLKCFDSDEPPLPPWLDASPERPLPDDFLLALRDGQRLVKLHNTLVERSRRQFDRIKTWHTDVAKPYRMAENLRYWVKAAELRWEIKLVVPVSEIVNNRQDGEAWGEFDEAVFQWARGVRVEMMEEWRLEARGVERKRAPELRVEVPGSEEYVVEIGEMAVG